MIHCHMTQDPVFHALLHTYNSTHYSTISKVPHVMNWAKAECIWEWLYSPWCPRSVAGLWRICLSTGDRVRMSKTQGQFDKGYKDHWSKEIFHVEAVQDSGPVTYVVADAAGEPIKGPLYGPELRMVIPPDYFDVDAILDARQHGNTTQYLVKWACYLDSFNSWECDEVRLSGDSIMPHHRLDHCHRRQHQAGLFFQSIPRWWLLHSLPPTPWSSHCLAMPARAYA